MIEGTRFRAMYPLLFIFLLTLLTAAPMRRFDNTALWKVLKTYDNLSNVITAGLDEALDEFVVTLHKYCREERCIAEKTRSLNYAKSELWEHLESNRFEPKKYASFRIMVKRAIFFIDDELNLIRMDLEHPERFIEFPSDNPPLARWGGSIADLIEYHVAPQAAGKLLKPSGEPMNYEESIEFLERTYGISIPNPHDRRGRVLDRQKNTGFQDEMRRVYVEEVKKRDK